MTRAAFYKGHEAFAIEAIETPPPAAGEVAIDVAYCGICGTDLHVFHGNSFQGAPFHSAKCKLFGPLLKLYMG